MCVCVCLFVCLFVRLQVSPRRIELAVSNFSCGSSAPKAGKHTFLWTLLPQKPKIGRIDQRAGHAHVDVNITVEMRRRKHHARNVPFVEYRAPCVDVESACVDIGLSPLTYVLFHVSDSREWKLENLCCIRLHVSVCLIKVCDQRITNK